MAKFIEVHKGDAPYLLNLDDISSITAFGGETCFGTETGTAPSMTRALTRFV